MYIIPNSNAINKKWINKNIIVIFKNMKDYKIWYTWKASDTVFRF